MSRVTYDAGTMTITVDGLEDVERALGDLKKKTPAAAPYIVARMTGGAIKDESGPQTVEFSLIVCAYDEGGAREGYQDVANIKEDIVQRVCTRPYFGGAFTILKPVVWAMQQDDTHPYYFGACTLTCTAPAMTQDTELEGLV